MDSRIREALERIANECDIGEHTEIARKAILTAEPEPCEFCKFYEGCEHTFEHKTDASQVADKRAEELRALREALEPFADADCEDERHSDEDDPQLLSCEEYGKPRAEWCAVCNAKAVLAATEPKHSVKEN